MRLRVLLLISAAVLAYVATRRSGSDADIWDGLEKDWWG